MGWLWIRPVYYWTYSGLSMSYNLSGDVVLANRGFVIEEILGAHVASLCIPCLKGQRSIFSRWNIEKTRSFANVKDSYMSKGLLDLLDNVSAAGLYPKIVSTKTRRGLMLDAIVRVCCALNNMCVEFEVVPLFWKHIYIVLILFYIIVSLIYLLQ